MVQLLALVLRALSVLSELLGIAQIIRGFTEQGAKERRPFSIEDYSGEILAALQNPTTGLAAIHADLADGITDILAAFDGVAQSGYPPSWWVDPPTPPPAVDIATEVWDTQSGMQTIGTDELGLPYAQLLSDAWAWISQQVGWQGVPLPHNPAFALVEWEPYKVADPFFTWTSWYDAGYPDAPDWSSVLAGDTPYAFLARTQPAYTWTNVNPAGIVSAEVAWKQIGGGDHRQEWVRSRFTSMDLASLASMVPPPPPQLPPPPVYPGAGGITLGTPVALDEDTTIPGPMHGVNIAITTPPHGLGKFSMGGRTWWYRLGQIAFVDDAGNVEPWQYISWDLALYTPSRMTEADHAIVRLLGGAEGTGTPWARTE